MYISGFEEKKLFRRWRTGHACTVCSKFTVRISETGYIKKITTFDFMFRSVLSSSFCITGLCSPQRTLCAAASISGVYPAYVIISEIHVSNLHRLSSCSVHTGIPHFDFEGYTPL